MHQDGKRWRVWDKYGNPVYLTEERWQHIIDPNNHPEMMDFEAHLQATIKKGRRQQEPLNPRKYRYVYHFDDLPEAFNHLVVIVLFGFEVDEQGRTISNHYVATAFMKHIWIKR